MRNGATTGRHWIGRLAVAVVSVALVVACSDDDSSTNTTTDGTTETSGVDTSVGSSTSPPAPTSIAAAEIKRGGVLQVGVEADTNGWVPPIMQCDEACQIRARTFFEPLFAVDTDLVLKGYLAESIEPDSAYTTWTIKLRPGIKFHDGEPFNAVAVVTALQRSAVTGFVGQSLSEIKGAGPGNDPAGVAIKAIDDLTVQIETSRPWPALPYYLASQGAFMPSPKWYEQVFANPAAPDAVAGARPVGTGPFKFVSWKPGDTLIVEKNPDYWRKDTAGNPIPYLDGIEFRVIPDELTRAKGLEDGQLDFMPTDLGENIKRFRDNDDFTLIEQSELTETIYTLLHVGQADSPLADRRVRCGLAAATDQQSIADNIHAGVFPVANGPFSPGQQGYLADNGYQAYDADTAAKLIADYTAEKGKPKVVYAAIPDQTALNAAAILQQWWGDAGIEVQIDQVEQQRMILNALLGDPSFMAFNWRNHSGAIIDGQYVWWHSKYATSTGIPGLNFGRVRDPLIDEMLDKARVEPDPAKQQAYAEEINRQFAKECYILPNVWLTWGLVASPDVKGIDNSSEHPAGGYLLDAHGTTSQGQIYFFQTWLDR